MFDLASAKVLPLLRCACWSNDMHLHPTYPCMTNTPGPPVCCSDPFPAKRSMRLAARVDDGTTQLEQLQRRLAGVEAEMKRRNEA